MTEKWGQIQGKWDLLRVSGEFELSELELTEQKRLKSGVKSKENRTWFELASREFELSELELSGFYCICFYTLELLKTKL